MVEALALRRPRRRQRMRPFVVNKDASCTPAEEAKLAKDGSYPSGHSVLGWAGRCCWRS